MKDRKKFWIIFVSTLIVSLILSFFQGCKPLPPSKLASGIKHGNNGTDTGWFQYVMTTNDEIRQEGIAMSCVITKTVYCRSNGCGGIEVVAIEDGVQGLETTGITGIEGQMLVRGKRYNWNAHSSRWLITEAIVSNPSKTMFPAYLDYSTIPTRQVTMTDYGKGRVTMYIVATAMKTQKESSALSNPTLNPPASGVSVVDCSIIQQQSNSVVELNSFMACNLTQESDFLKYAAPTMISVVFKTAQPAEISGLSISINVKTDAFPDGKTLSLNIIGSSPDKMTHVSRTEYFIAEDSTIQVPPEVRVYDRWTPFPDPNIWDLNQYVRSVKEDWLDIIDPNLYSDPNICPDPNILFDPHNPDLYNFTSRLDTSADNFDSILIQSRIIPVKTIALGAEGDNLDIDINWSDPRLIMLIAPNWLTGNKIYDRNGDGVVNMKDLP
jgi:hypothetical protein